MENREWNINKTVFILTLFFKTFFFEILALPVARLIQ
jgi:hypothetical protein